MAKQRPRTHHVGPNLGGGWGAKRGGFARASDHHDLKQDAIEAGRKIGQNQTTELRIHNEDGKISQSDSHGGDPHPPKG